MSCRHGCVLSKRSIKKKWSSLAWPNLSSAVSIMRLWTMASRGVKTCRLPSASAITSTAHKIEAFFRKWLRRLPHPFSPRDRRAGYRYDLSILQGEFSLTQIWDQAVSGRCFFDEVIRENIDLGRPEQVQLIFGRKLRKATVADGRCRTRIYNSRSHPFGAHLLQAQPSQAVSQSGKETRGTAHRDDGQQHL